MNGHVREPEWQKWLVAGATVIVVTGLALWVLELILDAINKGPK